MFTKQDYQEYFNQIAVLERGMIYQLRDTITLLTDTKIKNIFESIFNEEIVHYMYARWVLDTLLFDPKIEKRRHERKDLLGNVVMQQSATGRTIHARCINISPSGICIGIECEEVLEVDDTFALTITLYGQPSDLSAQGKVVWFKKMQLTLFAEETVTLYLGGIAFDHTIKLV